MNYKIVHGLMFILGFVGAWVSLFKLWDQPVEAMKVIGMFTILGYIALNNLFD